MPADAPAMKVGNVRKMGAEVVPSTAFATTAGDRGAPHIERGMVLVPPFDDPAIIAGQGTIGLELMRRRRRLACSLDAVVVPCGGGGLISGISVARQGCLARHRGLGGGAASISTTRAARSPPAPGLRTNRATVRSAMRS